MANFCPNCGSAVNQTDTFCPTCGSAIVGSTSGLPAGVPINTPPPTQQYYQSVPPVQSTASNILGTLVAVNLINGLTRQLLLRRQILSRPLLQKSVFANGYDCRQT